MFVMSNLPVLIIFCPLLGALVCPVISWFNRKAGRWTVTAMAGLSLVLAVLQLRQITEIGPIHYWFGNWKPPYGIEFSIDSLSGVLLVLICFMGFLSTLYSMPLLEGNSRFRSAGYYSILSLLITGLLGMTSTATCLTCTSFWRSRRCPAMPSSPWAETRALRLPFGIC